MEEKFFLKPKHIKLMIKESQSQEEMAIKYNLTLSQLRWQLSGFYPTIIYNEDELYYEFEEYIKRNYYMNLFRDLEITESTRNKIIKSKPVFANNLIKMLHYFDVKYEIKVEIVDKKRASYEYPKYVLKLPKFTQRSIKPREVKETAIKTVDDDLKALLRARERELDELHKMIGIRRKTLSEVLKRKGHGIEFINQVLDVVDELAIEVSEFSIKCEKYGGGNKILDNIAKKRISQYE